MRFSLLHKLTSYLLVAAGFSAPAFSGELSPVALGITVILGLASFFAEPARFPWMLRRPWTYLWNAATVVCFTWSVYEVLRGEPPLLTGVRFLCFLLVNKLCNRRASKDYLQAYLISFLMLVAGTSLNTDLVFALCFLVYVIAATWTLTLFHLRREMEDNYLLKHGDGATERVEVERVLNSRRIVGGGFLLGTSLISASIFAVSSVFFFAFPRVGFNLFFAHARHGLRVGFNDRGVELGQNGRIKDDEQVVMRVEYPDGQPRTPPYLRGISFDHYENGRWSPSKNQTRVLKRMAGFTMVDLAKEQHLDEASFHRALDKAQKQEIYLEPMDASVLFAAERPVALAIPYSRPGGAQQPTAEGMWLDESGGGYGNELQLPTGDIYAGGRQTGIKYTAWSHVDAPPAAELARASLTDEDIDTFAPYLDVDKVPQSVLELGRRITQAAKTPHEKVEAVLAYLARGFRYTLEMEHDPKREPIEEFLLGRKAGHCEYFASAMAILLRAAGVPTRHVAGFYGGEWNDGGHYLQVRQRDAHAWVEVYFGKPVGWVTFDPTPATGAGITSGGAADRLRQMLDVIEFAWFKYVIEYDLGTQMDLFAHFRRWASSDAGQAKKGRAAAATSRRDVGRALAVAIAVFCVLAAFVVLVRRSKVAPTSRMVTRATRALERALRALERRGTARKTWETPAEVGLRAAERHDPGAAAFRELVALYYQARYGARQVDEQLLDMLAAQVIRPAQSHPPVERIDRHRGAD